MSKNLEPYLERLPLFLGVRADSSKTHSLALVPMRLFFGATFIYAGLQKLTDSQFFSPTAPGFIGHQMNGFVHAGSPLSSLISSIALPHAAPFGALIAFCELWVGLSALLGLLTRPGALGGLAISLTFYLTATWNTHPYFLGADLPYALGWLTLALAGPDLLTMDNYFFNRARYQPVASSRERGRRSLVPSPSLAGSLPRKAAMRGLGTAVGVLVGGGIIGVIAKALTPGTSLANTGSTLAANPQAPATGGQTLLGSVKSLAVNSAAQYTDPTSGDPALLIHLPDGKFVAYDAVCTHAGCTVQYDPTQQQLVCPCHGAAFDAAHAAAVVNGPAQSPLATLKVKIDAKGNAYAG